MLQPRRTKYRNQFRTGARGLASRGTRLAFGDFGLKSMANGWLSQQQLEAARRAITHFTQRGGKVWIRLFPDKPITSKSAGSGMGAGKGDINGYVAVVTPGKVIFEIAGVTREIGQQALLRASHKLPVRTRFVEKTFK